MKEISFGRRSPGRMQFYLDDPTNIYATYTPADLRKDAIWPFDTGEFFLILNLALVGTWGGLIDDSILPQRMTVDYVRVYQKQ